MNQEEGLNIYLKETTEIHEHFDRAYAEIEDVYEDIEK